MKRFIAIAACAAALTAGANSRYISTVHEFCPAPGQFIHEIPMLTDDMSAAEVLAAVAEQICGNETDGATPGMISLGAFGGYVTFSFDHPVVNVAGQPDFTVYGNAFKGDMTDDDASSEPGIVMVSVDTNGNGLPDDEWFELRGSAHADATAGFEITYRRPAAETDPVTWTSNCEARPSGTIERHPYHTQSYWPAWWAGESITLRGTLLPDNARNVGTADEPYWVLSSFESGYVDNQPNTEFAGLNIDNAVDAKGEAVHLDAIDFVRVYTAMNQICGWIGETSTEITGGEDLHPDAIAGLTTVGTDSSAAAEYFDLRGYRVSPDALAPGIYICRRGSTASKILVR